MDAPRTRPRTRTAARAPRPTIGRPVGGRRPRNPNATLDRLREIVGTDTAAAALCGLTAAGYSNARARGSVPYSHIVAAVRAGQISVDLHWLFTGTPFSAHDHETDMTHTAIPAAEPRPEMLAAAAAQAPAPAHPDPSADPTRWTIDPRSWLHHHCDRSGSMGRELLAAPAWLALAEWTGGATPHALVACSGPTLVALPSAYLAPAAERRYADTLQLEGFLADTLRRLIAIADLPAVATVRRTDLVALRYAEDAPECWHAPTGRHILATILLGVLAELPGDEITIHALPAGEEASHALAFRGPAKLPWVLVVSATTFAEASR